MTLRSRLMALEKDAPPAGPSPFVLLAERMRLRREFREKRARYEAGLETEPPVRPHADGEWQPVVFTERDLRGLAKRMQQARARRVSAA